jgi:hypothetical protein
MSITKRTPNKEKLEDEIIKKGQVEIEKKLRNDYMAKIRGDVMFQRFIVNDIIKKRINELSNLDNLKRHISRTGDDREALGAIVIESILAKAQLEKMLSDILDS